MLNVFIAGENVCIIRYMIVKSDIATSSCITLAPNTREIITEALRIENIFGAAKIDGQRQRNHTGFFLFWLVIFSSTVTVMVNQCHIASAMTRMWLSWWYHCAPSLIPSRACLSTANLLRSSLVIWHLIRHNSTDYTINYTSIIGSSELINPNVLYFPLIICAPCPFADQLTVNSAPV